MALVARPHMPPYRPLSAPEMHSWEPDLDLLDGHRLSVCLSPALLSDQRCCQLLGEHPCAQLPTDSGRKEAVTEADAEVGRGSTRYTVANPPDLRSPHTIAVSGRSHETHAHATERRIWHANPQHSRDAGLHMRDRARGVVVAPELAPNIVLVHAGPEY